MPCAKVHGAAAALSVLSGSACPRQFTWEDGA